jgi:uncharacterized protein YegP (UPF0339 family)
MLEFFVDEAGETRYRIKGRNGEPMVTSEGYRDATDAKRGFNDFAKLMDDYMALDEQGDWILE